MRQILGLSAALCLLALPPRASAGYLVTDLGSLSPVGLNNSGQVVGEFGTGPGPFSVALYSGGTTVALGLGADSFARGINASGQVVGGSGGHAFLYGGGKLTDLGALPGYPMSFAAGINTPGQVVGASFTADDAHWHAFLYSGGTMTDLGTLGGANSRAAGINASGQVVGESNTAGGDTHAFRYGGGHMTDVGGLGGGYVNSSATAINASGQVVGVSYTADSKYGHAFRYSNGTMVNLGGLGGTWSAALGINTAGQVVGWSTTAGGSNHAFLYTGGQMVDLNTLLHPGSGFTLTSASGINDKGQIAAQGSNGHGYLLTPESVAATPEPGGLTLLALGAAGLLGRARCRRRKVAS
jgi:probable HAF family extracellular repeat protein